MRYARLMWTRDSDKDRMSSSVKALTPTVCPRKARHHPDEPGNEENDTLVQAFVLPLVGEILLVGRRTVKVVPSPGTLS
ncbi:MAG: hypothetical protein ACLFUX_09910, partial [Spirochaetaceae bacterium]